MILITSFHWSLSLNFPVYKVSVDCCFLLHFGGPFGAQQGFGAGEKEQKGMREGKAEGFF